MRSQSSTTLKERVTQFWNWFPAMAERFQQSILDGNAQEVVSEVGKFMDQHLPALSWSIGQENDDSFSFTVTGEGQPPRQLVAEFWRSQAIQLEKWTFYAARQPSTAEALKDIAIRVSPEEQVDASSVLIKTTMNEDEQQIDIAAWHPAFQDLPDEHRYQILFLLLDESLGEFGTQSWIGEIEITPVEESRHTRRLIELPKFIEQAASYHKWEKLPPLEAYSVYEVPEPSDRPRGDTIVGSSCIPDVIFEYMEQGGQLDDNPLEDTGAELIYLAVDASVFPEGSETDTRSQLEDKLDQALADQKAGKTVGGAFGTRHSYIDVIIFDGENSRSIIKQTLSRLQLGDKYKICEFI